ncbi:hypothetical protein TYRP_012094 [Tyrophagus putrescentiae]|nr:hypothetical protein TYRP_012094 [Tyrophagus putrescentiae]
MSGGAEVLFFTDHAYQQQPQQQKTVLQAEDLVAVFAVIRHGDRAPTDFTASDPFADDRYWAPNGKGELNPWGIERMRESGRLYRDRYKAFLNGKPTTREWPVYVRSSTRNRTIQSASHFLEGFLNDSSPSTNLSSMITRDQRMLTTTYPCPLANAARLAFFETAPVTGYMASKRSRIEHLQQLTGEDFFAAAPYTLRQLEFLASTTTIERDEYKLDVADWIRDPANIELMDDFKRHANLFNWRPPTVQRYRVGPLLGDIRDNLQEIISSSGTSAKLLTSSNNNSSQVFFLYSTHDVNQVLLLQALGIYDQIGSWPPFYSGAIVFEAYKSSSKANQNVFLRTLYRQVERSEVPGEQTGGNSSFSYALVDQPLNITACANSLEVEILDSDGLQKSSTVEILCPFEEFKRLIVDKVPLNYEEEFHLIQ